MSKGKNARPAHLTPSGPALVTFHWRTQPITNTTDNKCSKNDATLLCHLFESAACQRSLFKLCFYVNYRSFRTFYCEARRSYLNNELSNTSHSWTKRSLSELSEIATRLMWTLLLNQMNNRWNFNPEAKHMALQPRFQSVFLTYSTFYYDPWIKSWINRHFYVTV